MLSQAMAGRAAVAAALNSCMALRQFARWRHVPARRAVSRLDAAQALGETRTRTARRALMDVYLPIAELSVNLFVLLGLGGAVGVLSGVFGVGGGFLLTPLLIFLGIPAPVAVASAAMQVLASSVSGAQAHLRRGNVDVRMGLVLVAGGLVGSAAGVWLFGVLRALGQIELVVALSYVLLLGTVGLLMLVESLRAWRRVRVQGPGFAKRHRHLWLHRLPYRVRFHRSRLYISALAPLAIGLAIGIMVSMMGVGGGFLLVPAMVYLLGMPTAVVIGTSLFQISFVTAVTTFLHALNHHSVDVLLALALIAGGVSGAQLGAGFGSRLRGEQMRALLALVVLGLCVKLVYDLVTRPGDLYSLGLVGLS